MIELPKRSITRFFVPLIDVLILLFCIFLLMPYVATPESTNGQPPDQGALSKDQADQLREKLKATEEKARILQDKLARPEERFYWRYLEINPDDGTISTFVDGERRLLKSATDAESLMRRTKQEAGKREPYYLVIFPRVRSGFPEQGQVDAYREWFRGATLQFDNPLNPSAFPAGSR